MSHEVTDGEAPPMPRGYRYVRHLGEGGFGAVHLAEHVATGRLAAVKHIQRHVLSDPATIERFRREARILAATDVASVVRIYDLDTTTDPAYLVMEYVPGVTLYDLMCVAPLPASQAIEVLRDVAEALGVMAEHGLVHRDIKPSNVFVLPDGHAKLGDFGLARAVLDDGGFRTTGAPAGTPAYFPPEVSSGLAEATPESDAYSFAVMAYEVLTGVRPIEAPDAVSLITAHWSQEPRPVQDALPGFPASAASVLMRALAKEPAGRPLPHQVVAALEAVPPEQWPTNHRPRIAVPSAPGPRDEPSPPPAGGGAPPTVAAGTPPHDPAPATEAAPPPAPLPPDPPGHRPHRPMTPGQRRTAIVAGIAALAAAAGGATWLVLREADEPPPPVPQALEVRTVTVTATPERVRCPQAQVRVVAVVTTNGAAGELVVAWQLPDGRSGPEQPFAVPESETEVRAVLDVELSGRRAFDGAAAAVVQPSGLRAEAPVRYACPERRR